LPGRRVLPGFIYYGMVADIKSVSPAGFRRISQRRKWIVG
jgi:hypothetical protein